MTSPGEPDPPRVGRLVDLVGNGPKDVALFAASLRAPGESLTQAKVRAAPR